MFQVNKMNLIARKLQLEPGMTVVDLGCGWGTLSCFLASNYGVKVTGVNISTEQVKFARELVAQRGLENQVTFILDDYRNLSGKFDRLVAVGLLEHVGLMNMPEFFDVAHQVLKPGGLALVHCITSGKTVHVQVDRFIQKYIFPNGYLPSPKLLVKYAESKFVVEDMQNFGVDYMRTLHVWHKRFKACVAKGVFDPEKQDETFVRMWEFYLLYSASGFKARIIHLYQVVYSKKRPEIYIAPR
ncbi:unnamed protein product [Notodromas monacha]|uniref:Cyclopropane-fatty-acyl-phospholipid synthase n=1 Tax=Notodromas monacha TaxID=399045 RepID=A0A7R9BXN9_9CRUS|nr:unnamed protein product [Notodromas monacha]CAG0922139.1 unnamed protein product [Notodromas monacha]